MTASTVAYRDPQVRRWLAGYAVSLVGDQAFFLALAVGATRTAGPGGAGLVLAVSSMPRAVLLLVGGALVDRWGERPLMLASDALRCVVMLVGAGYVVGRGLSLPLLLAVGAAFGVVDAVFLPAAGALPQRLVDPDELARISGMRSFAQRLSIALGAPAAGWVIAGGGIAGAFLVDGLSFVASFAGPFNIGVPLAGWSPGEIGLITGAFGVAAVACPLWLSARGGVPRVGPVRVATFALEGVTLAALGAVGSPAAAMAAAFGLGLAAGVLGTTTIALIQAGLDPAFRGRVMALLSLATMGGVPLSFLVTGLAVGAVGVPATFLGAGAVGLASATVTLADRSRRLAVL